MLWLYSVGFTAGGLLYSMRMLSPLLLLLAVSGGGLLSHYCSTGKRAKKIVVISLYCLFIPTILQHLLVPYLLHIRNIRNLYQIAFAHTKPSEKLNFFIDKVIPRQKRVLTANAYAFMASETVKTVPVWSPEVCFVFDDNMPYNRKLRKLSELNINYVLVSPNATMKYLAKHSFYRRLLQKRPVLIIRINGVHFLYKL